MTQVTAEVSQAFRTGYHLHRAQLIAQLQLLDAQANRILHGQSQTYQRNAARETGRRVVLASEALAELVWELVGDTSECGDGYEPTGPQLEELLSSDDLLTRPSPHSPDHPRSPKEVAP